MKKSVALALLGLHGLEHPPTKKEIEAAWRASMQLNHPDRFTDNETLRKYAQGQCYLINEARDVLLGRSRSEREDPTEKAATVDDWEGESSGEHSKNANRTTQTKPPPASENSEEAKAPSDSNTNAEIPNNNAGAKKGKQSNVGKAFFIRVSSAFALVLVLVWVTLATAKTWTKVDVPAHMETFHEETYFTGNYIVTMDDSNPCWVNQGWADCINFQVNEYNRECANHSLTSSSSSLCERYLEMINDMKARDGGYGWHVTSLGDWGHLHSTQETATKKVSNNDYRPAVTHEATCYWGIFGECPDD